MRWWSSLGLELSLSHTLSTRCRPTTSTHTAWPACRPRGRTDRRPRALGGRKQMPPAHASGRLRSEQQEPLRRPPAHASGRLRSEQQEPLRMPPAHASGRLRSEQQEPTRLGSRGSARRLPDGRPSWRRSGGRTDHRPRSLGGRKQMPPAHASGRLRSEQP